MIGLEAVTSAQIKTIANSLADVLGLIGLSLVAYFSSKLKNMWKDRKLKKLSKGINHNMKIREFMSELRGIYDSDRVGLFQFHNGEYYMSGESTMKTTLTHIVLNVGVAFPSPAPNTLQNIATSYFSALLQRMKNEGYAFYNSANPPEDSYLQHLFNQSGTKTSMFVPVSNIRGHWIGFLIVTWLDEREKPQLETLQKYRIMAGTQLSLGA